MPSRPAGYQPLAQSLEEEDPDIDDVLPQPITQPTLGRQRRARPGSIDLSKLDNAFRKWTEAIQKKVKKKKKVADDHSKKEIWRSVFDPQVVLPLSAPTLPVKTFNHKPPMTDSEFDSITQSVREAISEGIHPKMITKGSSGSYFARAKDEEGRVHTVAVFKPKDEEPYGRLNPKTMKWLHRQFSFIIPFGRACLIPNLSYISEAAASMLDTRLNLNIVPPTRLVSFSSPAFFYDWIDVVSAKNGKPLPEKIGSMQYFLHGFQDASDFLRQHPWPGRSIADTFGDTTHRQGGATKRILGTLKIVCGKTGDMDDDDLEDADYEDNQGMYEEEADSSRPFYWSATLQQSLRAELEKLVILDYLMLNTDRGQDNWMLKKCDQDHEKPLVDVPPSRSIHQEMPVMSELRRGEATTSPHTASQITSSLLGTSSSFQGDQNSYTRKPHIHIAAIDNSLSFPHEHPKGWRSYTYGWLYLPVSLIGRPFSEQTRNHFLPLLTSKSWWEETTYQLKKLHAVDPDFHDKMFKKQLAVMKGQAWNIIQSLRHADEGPLELTRRQKVLVWDDDVEISENEYENDAVTEAHMTSSPHQSFTSVPLPRRTRSQSGGDFPPAMIRTLTEASGAPRPVPFSAKFQRVSPALTGVSVLEHLERLDAVEASLRRLGVESDEEEVDVGETPSKPTRPTVPPITIERQDSTSSAQAASSPHEAPLSPLPTVHEVHSDANSIAEEDLAAMSKSTSFAETSSRNHTRWTSLVGPSTSPGQDLDWIRGEDVVLKRQVIVERLETVDHQPLCSCW